MNYKKVEPEKKLLRFFQGWDFIFIFLSFLPLCLLGVYLLFSKNIPKTIEEFSDFIGVFALLTSFLMIFGFFFSYKKMVEIDDKGEQELKAPLLFLLKVYILTSVVPLLFISIFTLLWIFPILIHEKKFNLLYIITVLIGFTFLLSFFTFFSFRKKLFYLFNILKEEGRKTEEIANSQIDLFETRDFEKLYGNFEKLYNKLFKLDFFSIILRRGIVKTLDLNKDKIIRFLDELGEGNEFNLELYDEREDFGDAKFLYIMKSEIKNGYSYAIAGNKNRNFFDGEVVKMRTLFKYFNIYLRRMDYEDAQINFFTHIVNIIVMSLEGNIVPKNHLQNVAKYSNMIARGLELDERRRRRLHFASLLHDIGFLKIPVEIQGLPEKYKLHPTLGAELVGEIELWKRLAPIIRYHHEAFDGSGYPEGLKGEEIPLESRIIAVAESFDAITNEYSYKAIVDEKYALSDIESKAGEKYDPEVVTAFVKCFREK